MEEVLLSNNYDVRNILKVQELKNKVEEYQLNDDIFLIKSDVFFKEEKKMEMVSSINGLLITINLNGGISHTSLSSGLDLNLRKNTTTMNLMKIEEGVDTVEANTHLQNLNIIFKKEFIQNNLSENSSYEKLMEFFEKKIDSINLKDSETNLQNQIIANDIFNSPHSGDLNKIFLQSKVLEILVNELKELDEKNEQSKKINVKFSDYDKEAIYKARDILLENLHNPPSIAELSKKVALNEFKLKIGFNTFFHTSPYRMLNEYRMLKAKEFLEKSDMNVSEISKAVGYKYIHNFSKVFSQRFGVRPKDIMKSRKYYY